mgnify:FL=1
MVEQAQLVEIYQTSKSNVSEHLSNIFADGELIKDSVVRNFRTTASDGKNYNVAHYNLDVVIALGYRVQSPLLESDFDKEIKRLRDLNK